MASSHSRLWRLVVGLVGAGLLVALISLLSRIGVSVNRIFGSHAGLALTQPQVAIAYRDATSAGGRRPSRPVPRIIHQIFHNWKDPGNETLPPDWQEIRQTCIALHPTWDHKLWNEKASRSFIESEYPWFLETYESFKYPVQRVDTLRLFLMRHFGGIYMDLDNGCRANLEPLLYYPAWTTDGGHGTLSNNILGAAPEHPFFILMTESIFPWARDLVLTYMTISYATVQWFLTELWQIYHAQKPRGDPDLVRLMMDMRPTGAPWVFFTAGRGGTWDNWDNRVLGWIGNHLFLALLFALAGVGLLGGALALLGRTLRRTRSIEGWTQMEMTA